MEKLRLLFFALDAAGRAGLNYTGASMAGGELRRRRAMAYKKLYEDAVGQLTDR